MENPLDLIERFDEITPQWLTNAFRKGGVVKNAVVESVDIEEQGLAANFMSDLARITPHYSQGGEDAPTSMIAKLPSLDPATQALATSLHMYERESRFYQEIGSEAGIQTLTCYYGAMDLAQTRHVLLLEDSGPVGLHEPRPEATVEEARRVLRGLAGMHAKWWNSEELESFPWLWTVESQSLTIAIPRKYRAGWEDVKERFSGRLPEGIEEVGDRFERVIVDMLQRNITPPITLVHGDVRPENIRFHDDNEGITAVSWHLTGKRHGATDIAQFIPYALSMEDRRASEEHLLRSYLDALHESGVNDYSFDQLVEHYRLGLLSNLLYFVIGDENFDLEVSEGEIWNTRRIDSLQALIDWNVVELLPELE